MSFERLDALFAAPIVSHVLLFTDTANGAEVGAATLYLEAPRAAYYYYAFYDLNYYRRNLGMYMMTSAVACFAERGFRHVYLGTCYSRNALYKTQFMGAQFFNGYRWSDNLSELKYILERDQGAPPHQHLLESEDYRQNFCAGGLGQIAALSRFQAPVGPGKQAD